MVKWSFSGLKDFVNCPRQYNEVKVKQNYTKGVTEQMRYGTDVHKALEEYVRDGTPLPDFYTRFKKTVDALKEIPGEQYVEYKMALREDKSPCDFTAPDYWVRGIVDLMIIDGDTAFVTDYKTGSAKYPDSKQLMLMALMTFAHFPEVKHVKGALVFLLNNAFVTEDYSRAKANSYWARFAPDVMRLKMAIDTDVWTPNPTPLCGWCPVTTCQFHKER
jgi:hypothetical protein